MQIEAQVEVTMVMSLKEAKTIRRALAFAPEEEVPGVNQLYYQITVALEAEEEKPE